MLLLAAGGLQSPEPRVSLLPTPKCADGNIVPSMARKSRKNVNFMVFYGVTIFVTNETSACVYPPKMGHLFNSHIGGGSHTQTYTYTPITLGDMW